jgi:hypothetical protein
MCHVVNTARARAMQNGFLNTQKNGENVHSTPSRPCRVPPALVCRGWARQLAHGGRLWHSKLQVAAVASRYGR